MRICIPVLGFSASGGNRVLSRLSNEWIRAGLNVEFLSESIDTEPAFETHAKVIRAAGGSNAARKKENHFFRALRIVHRILNLALQLRRNRNHYDVFLANHPFTALACILGGVRNKAVYYIQAYEPELFLGRGFFYWIGSNLIKISYCAIRRHVVNSEHYRSYKHISRDAGIIYPGLDNAVFFPKNLVDTRNGDKKIIGIIGRSETYKHNPVIKAYKLLEASGQNVHLRIAYNNIPATALSDLKSYEIVIPDDDSGLADFYRSCDIFLALTEFPAGAFYPPLESLCCGTTVISQPFAFMNDGNCFLVQSPEDVPYAFNQIIKYPDLAREKMVRGIEDISQLNWPVLADNFISILHMHFDSSLRKDLI